MAKVTVGSLSTFNHEVQEWAIYKDRLEQWFLANELEEGEDKSGAKRRAILLSSLTEATYKLVRDLALPAVVANLSYADVVKLLDEHFQSKKCGFAERYTFHTAVQYANETMAEWAARVRGLAAHCEFSAEAFGDLLRDRFVLGMVHGPERDKLFTTNMKDVTLKKALEIAEGMRSARLGSQRGQQAAAGTSEAHIPLQVLKMSTRAARSGGGGSEGQPRAQRRPGAGACTQAAADADAGARAAACEVCGYAGHGADSCRFKHHVCKRCGVRGHLKRMCTKSVSRQYYVECDADDDYEVNAEDQPTQLKGSSGPHGADIFPLRGKRVQSAPTSQWERDFDYVSQWPNGVVRYYVDPSSYDSHVVGYLKIAFSQLADLNSCPEFVQLDSKPQDGSSWLHFTNPARVRECVHDVGTEGEIVVVLGYDCMQRAEILHTVMHGLGFRDEITHPKRDLFARVQWDNIQPAFRSMFRVHQASTSAIMGFDPKSIMNFHDRAFSLNGQATVIPLHPGLIIEPTEELSQSDKIKLLLTFSHECKERQINKILKPCGGTSNKLGDGQLETIVVPGRDVPNIKPDDSGSQSDGGGQPDGGETDGGQTNNGGQTDGGQTDGGQTNGGQSSDGQADGGDANLMVVPGADINPEADPQNDDGATNIDNDQGDPETLSGNNNAQVKPGNKDDDMNLQSGNDEVLVPAPKLKIDNDNDNNVEMDDGGNTNDEKEQAVVIAGNDVQLDSGADQANDSAAAAKRRRRGSKRRPSRFNKYAQR